MDAEDPHKAFWCKSAGPWRLGSRQWCAVTASSERASCSTLMWFLYVGCRVVLMTCTDLNLLQYTLCIRVTFFFRTPSCCRAWPTPLPPALCFPQQRERSLPGLAEALGTGRCESSGGAALLCAVGWRAGWLGNFYKQRCFKLLLPLRALEWSIWGKNAIKLQNSGLFLSFLIRCSLCYCSNITILHVLSGLFNC